MTTYKVYVGRKAESDEDLETKKAVKTLGRVVLENVFGEGDTVDEIYERIPEDYILDVMEILSVVGLTKEKVRDMFEDAGFVVLEIQEMEG